MFLNQLLKNNIWRVRSRNHSYSKLNYIFFTKQSSLKLKKKKTVAKYKVFYKSIDLRTIEHLRAWDIYKS